MYNVQTEKLLKYYSYLPDKQIGSIKQHLSENYLKKFIFANINDCDIFGNTQLHYAAMNGDLEEFSKLILLGSDSAIQNLEGYNSFDLLDYSIIDDLFWKPSFKFMSSLDLNIWSKSNICVGFKKILFQRYISNRPTKFKDITDVEFFLKSLKIYDQKSVCLAIVSSNKILKNLSAIINWLKFSENAGFYTSLFIKEAPIGLCSRLGHEFWLLPMDCNENFFITISVYIEQIDKDERVRVIFRNLIKKLIESGCYEDVRTQYHSIFNDIYLNKNCYMIFLDELLVYRRAEGRIPVTKI